MKSYPRTNAIGFHRQFPRFTGDLLRLRMERSDLRLQLLPLRGEAPVDHGFILLRFSVDLFLNPNSEVAGVTHWILTMDYTDYTDYTDFRMHQTGLENVSTTSS